MIDELLLFLKVIIALGVTLLMIYILAKVGNKSIDSSNNGKQIKVLEKTQISKENSLLIVKIRDKGYVMSSNTGKVEILSEISKEDIDTIEEEQKKAREEMINKYSNVASTIKEKLQNIKFKGR